MDLATVVCKECCALLRGKTKSEALIELMDLLARHGHVRDVEALKREVFYREQLMSTGIGLGVAIPHVRFAEISEPVIAVGLQPEGIRDYQSIDDEVVRIVVMILAGPKQHKEHIRLLALIVGRIKQPEVKTRLLAASTGAQIFNVLAESTSKRATA